MKHITSYGVKFRDGYDAVNRTMDIYRDAVEYLLPVIEAHWDDIQPISNGKARMNYVEHLIHTAKTHTAIYDFDKRFHKFPSYFRRSAIVEAIGAYSSWRSNHDNWIADGCRGAEPKPGAGHDICPVFYYGNMFKHKDRHTAMIKLRRNNDWVWVTIRLNASDMKYLEKRMSGRECHVSAPIIIKKHGHYELRFTLEEQIELSSTPLQDQKICAVDLGITTDAACSVMDVHGTILARRFIRCGREQDSVHTALQRVSDFQREHGSHDSGRLWNISKNRNLNLAHQVANRIVTFAREHQCDVIVMEHLDTSGRKRGSKKQRLTMWKHRDIENTVERLAHRYGIRIAHVCAWKTSRLAFDGSGSVRRGREVSEDTPYDVCQFTTGKFYNCDLSASYNIGARYFLKRLCTELADIMAEVPDISSGTRRVLADLWRADAYLQARTV